MKRRWLIRSLWSWILLAPLLLALPPELAGATLDVAWRATSRSTDGDLSGTATLVIPTEDIVGRADDENAIDDG